MSDHKDKGQQKPAETKVAAPSAAPSASLPQPVDTGAATSPGELGKPAEERTERTGDAMFGGAYDAPLRSGEKKEKTQKELVREQLEAQNRPVPKRSKNRATYSQLQEAVREGKHVRVVSLLDPVPSNHVAPWVGLISREPRVVSMAGAPPDAAHALAADESIDIVIEE